MHLPPVFDTVTAKLTRILARIECHIAHISFYVIDSMGDNDFFCARKEIMIVHLDRLGTIDLPLPVKGAYCLFFLTSRLMTGSPLFMCSSFNILIFLN